MCLSRPPTWPPALAIPSSAITSPVPCDKSLHLYIHTIYYVSLEKPNQCIVFKTVKKETKLSPKIHIQNLVGVCILILWAKEKRKHTIIARPRHVLDHPVVCLIHETRGWPWSCLPVDSTKTIKMTAGDSVVKIPWPGKQLCAPPQERTPRSFLSRLSVLSQSNIHFDLPSGCQFVTWLGSLTRSCKEMKKGQTQTHRHSNLGSGHSHGVAATQ